jgi:hypothetical protein
VAREVRLNRLPTLGRVKARGNRKAEMAEGRLQMADRRRQSSARRAADLRPAALSQYCCLLTSDYWLLTPAPKSDI